MTLREATWVDDAKCRGMEQTPFFPERGATPEAVRAICHECPVRLACLQYALEEDIRYGIWGGKSARQRDRIRRKWLAEKRAEKAAAAWR